MERSTSSIRSISTMRATLRSVVVPLFSSEAHSRATAAFLLLLTVTDPASAWPPVTRRWVGPDGPAVISSPPVASSVKDIVAHVISDVGCVRAVCSSASAVLPLQVCRRLGTHAMSHFHDALHYNFCVIAGISVTKVVQLI